MNVQQKGQILVNMMESVSILLDPTNVGVKRDTLDQGVR